MTNSELRADGCLVSVDRAMAELRRGRFVVIEGGDGAALAQAAETVTRESLAALGRLGAGQACLALTAERARALNLPATGAGEAVALPLDAGVDANAIRWLADPTFQVSAIPSAPAGLRPVADDGCLAAAIRLAKLAHLLPAVVAADLPGEVFVGLEAFAAESNLLRVGARAIADYPGLAAATLRPAGAARVPLEAAESARVVGFRPADGSVEQFAILIGEPEKHQPALCRLHSECFTGDLLGSLRCDCGPQLQGALLRMAEEGHGVVLYLSQEGRGIGLINKLRAYQLQDAGLDTVDANQHLGFEPDERSFQAAAVMLRHLGIESVRLMTNNPAKVEALVEEGIEVVERVPHATAPTLHNRAYLRTKAVRSGHLLDMVPQA
jgi:GTP cyclohydrolase II